MRGDRAPAQIDTRPNKDGRHGPLGPNATPYAVEPHCGHLRPLVRFRPDEEIREVWEIYGRLGRSGDLGDLWRSRTCGHSWLQPDASDTLCVARTRGEFQSFIRERCALVLKPTPMKMICVSNELAPTWHGSRGDQGRSGEMAWGHQGRRSRQHRCALGGQTTWHQGVVSGLRSPVSVPWG